ncbi:unnamed protein product [Zymoseptoria tritici ST99CH_1A5]|uniref:Amino acid permease/ SLC12A domain-containing protein n=1 Tax=Zymoseptoria tritici ST99CH_1A5 TaxID=1276529 RepID=A0A1Y6LSQ1_ZYMTR|nr:unnamed protein product [Zymoseptoria tritici ST99CH_1A5]
MGEMNPLEPTESIARPKRHIGTLEIAAVGYSICNSWSGIMATFAFVVNQGGSPALLYGLVVVFVVYGCIAGTLSELASAYPSAGGQYHWTSILAPKRCANFLSYLCGSLNVFAWIAITAGVTVIVPQILFAVLVHFDTSYIPKPWHVFLIYQAVNVVCLIHNIFALRKSMWVFNYFLALSLAGFFVATVTCVARAPRYQSDEAVWITFTDRSGWNNQGVAFLTGLLSPGYMYAGFDGAIHLADEAMNASVAVPRAMLSTWLIGFVSAFVLATATMYSAQDFDLIAATPTGLPAFELLRQGMQSDAAATVIVLIIVVSAFAATAGCQQTASRLMWTFARDRGFICNHRFSRLNTRWQVPIWALCINAAVVFVIGCLYLASSTAFNAFIGTGLVLQLLTFAFHAALLLVRKRSAEFLPPTRKFRLPSAVGWIANFCTVGFALVCFVFYDLPAVLPVEAGNMNYSIAVIGVMVVAILINWLIYARIHYHGPDLEHLESF